MALTLVANYSKKVGLPNFSSHSFSISCTKEITSIDHVEEESTELYSILQHAVDSQLENVGYMPEQGGSTRVPTNRITTNGVRNDRPGSSWQCTEKQETLLKKLLKDRNLEQMAEEMFNQPVSSLNKMQASALIRRVLREHAPNVKNGSNGSVNGGGW
jgi:hypothetical protein